MRNGNIALLNNINLDFIGIRLRSLSAIARCPSFRFLAFSCRNKEPMWYTSPFDTGYTMFHTGNSSWLIDRPWPA